MCDLHYRHPGGTPEDEAAAIGSPRAYEKPSLADAQAAAADTPSSPLIARTAEDAAADAALASESKPGVRSPPPAEAAQATAAKSPPVRSKPRAQRGRLSLSVAALCGVAATVSVVSHAVAKSKLQVGSAWLTQAFFTFWIAHREAPAQAAIWVLATSILGAAVAGRRVESRKVAPKPESRSADASCSAYLACATEQAEGDAHVFWNGPQAPRERTE